MKTGWSLAARVMLYGLGILLLSVTLIVHSRLSAAVTISSEHYVNSAGDLLEWSAIPISSTSADFPGTFVVTTRLNAWREPALLLPPLVTLVQSETSIRALGAAQSMSDPDFERRLRVNHRRAVLTPDSSLVRPYVSVLEQSRTIFTDSIEPVPYWPGILFVTCVAIPAFAVAVAMSIACMWANFVTHRSRILAHGRGERAIVCHPCGLQIEGVSTAKCPRCGRPMELQSPPDER